MNEVVPLSRQGRPDEAASRHRARVEPEFATLHELVDDLVAWNWRKLASG